MFKEIICFKVVMQKKVILHDIERDPLYFSNTDFLGVLQILIRFGHYGLFCSYGLKTSESSEKQCCRGKDTRGGLSFGCDFFFFLKADLTRRWKQNLNNLVSLKLAYLHI